MIRNYARAAVAAAVLCACPLSADELRMTTLFRTGTVSKNVGAANLVVRDVVGDSRPDIVSCAAGSAFAMSANGNSYRDAWYSPYVQCTAVAVADRDGNGSNEVLVGTASNPFLTPPGPSYLYAYDATSYGPELAKIQVSATETVNDIAVGNVDGDAALEVVAVTNTKFYVFNAATFAQEWTGPYGGHTVAIADLENDGVNEIIIAGNLDGNVIDTSTQALKWNYPGGFGYSMAVGDVDNDGKMEILCGTRPSYGESVKVINGDTMTTVTLPLAAPTLTAGDANNDGQIELILGTQYDLVAGYSLSGSTVTKLWSIANPEYGVQGMAVGDPDGDGQNEIVWGAGALSSGPDKLFVGNANAQTREFDGVDLDGAFRTAVGDLDGDGDLEMVVTSQATNSGYGNSGMAYVLDYTTHRLIATLAVSAWDVAIGQVDGDTALEIIFFSNYINVFDGVTLAREWTSPVAQQYGYSPANVGVIVRNIDSDPLDEIIYATGDKKIQVLNGASEFAQFTSGALDNVVNDIAIADLDGDGILDLAVATHTGAYVFKTSDWSQRTYIPLASYTNRSIAAMPGHFAVTLAGNGIASYSGTALTQEWSCTSGSGSSDLAFLTLAGQSRLAAVMNDGTLRVFPLGGVSCPTYDTVSQSFGNVGFGNGLQLAFTDVNGDGRPELLAGSYYSTSIHALGWSSEPRGDADSDGAVTDADIDALSAYLYGSRTATQPAADVNGDGAIRPDDLFYLINYRRGTGPAPAAIQPTITLSGETE